MIYKLILGYVRAKYIGMIISSIFRRKIPTKGLKKLTLIEYALEFVNAYLTENKKSKHKRSK